MSNLRPSCHSVGLGTAEHGGAMATLLRCNGDASSGSDYHWLHVRLAYWQWVQSTEVTQLPPPLSSHDSDLLFVKSVGMVTGYGLDDRDSIPGRDGNESLSRHVQIGAGTLPPPYRMGTRPFFPEASVRSVKLTAHLHLYWGHGRKLHGRAPSRPPSNCSTSPTSVLTYTSFYLFVVYLMALLVIETTSRRMIGWPWIVNWKGCRKKCRGLI
jgi:hypothetical protein